MFLLFYIFFVERLCVCQPVMACVCVDVDAIVAFRLPTLSRISIPVGETLPALAGLPWGMSILTLVLIEQYDSCFYSNTSKNDRPLFGPTH